MPSLYRYCATETTARREAAFDASTRSLHVFAIAPSLHVVILRANRSTRREFPDARSVVRPARRFEATVLACFVGHCWEATPMMLKVGSAEVLLADGSTARGEYEVTLVRESAAR